ncbi:MAG: GGDEF domain-containing protein, partial [Clostridia bacterium]|nr:GGDEF domain-containing protein [Clostridia bacterium]
TITILFLISILIFQGAIILRFYNEKKRFSGELKKFKNTDALYKMAYTDDLTGLYNRAAFHKHSLSFEVGGRGKDSIIVLFDVDDFKKINDTQGHLAGDEVLKEVSEILTKVFSFPDCKVYRIGGDEFAVMTKGIDEDAVINVLIGMQKCLEKESTIRLSKGYAIINGDIDKAFDEADQMLYADKLRKNIHK